ncbi:MAG: L-histidine N(alpha)-methyltransferase [Bernardetiaceae bacterium]|nr:L-histidine N(alpha)-methyltransferase [Bernardetiaceae bacterium]
MSTFEQDIIHGLSQNPKTLPSKYFYDDQGSRLFQQIMALESYYLTDAEFAVFSMQKEKILAKFLEVYPEQVFDIIELGAGDGAKTQILLRHLVSQNIDFTYQPIDISGEAIALITQHLKEKVPNLPIQGLVGDYFEVLEKLQQSESLRPRIIFFLGSTIGNFKNNGEVSFLQKLQSYLRPKDSCFIGFDIKKSPSMILKAYNDPEGVTHAFNLNLLVRINRELGGNFDIANFEFCPTYNPITGEVRSYLVSTKAQEVYLAHIDKHFELDAWEPIHTETSKKYNQADIEHLAHQTGFQVLDYFYDCRHYFSDVLFQKSEALY